MRKTVLHVACAGLLALAAPALGGVVEVINFDDIDLGGADRNNFPALGIENSYHGYQWPSPNENQHWAVVNNSDGQFSSVGAYSGEQAGWNWSGSLVMDIIFDQAKVIHGAYFNVFSAGQSWGADTITFQGYDANDNLVGTSSTLTLDPKGSSPPWQWLEGDLTDVIRLRIVAAGGFGDTAWWTIDDLTISNVPGPGALALLAVGGMIGCRRRRR